MAQRAWTAPLNVRFDYQARFLAVYVRRNGVWPMVAEQSTEISGAPS